MVQAAVAQAAAIAGLDREVVIIGAIDRIEIWKLERWQSVSAEADASLLGAVTDLGI